ncbi:MAG: hypothetical protein Q8O17_00665 [Candidatus Methanoperedens sp.]|nr:hypothetical protein [Candidatus Methanoperedens sp.]
MIKLKNILLIAVIVSIVIFSGCTGGQEKKVTETAPPTPAQTTPVQTTIVQTTTPQAPQGPYQVQVTEVRTLSDCIKSPGSSEVKPCTLIDLQVKNNNVKSLDFKLVKEEVIAKNSRVLPGKYDKEVGLNDLCTHQEGMEFVLTENTQKIVGLCHPTINNADEPTLKVETLINGVRKEYEFDLT